MCYNPPPPLFLLLLMTVIYFHEYISKWIMSKYVSVLQIITKHSLLLLTIFLVVKSTVRPTVSCENINYLFCKVY